MKSPIDIERRRGAWSSYWAAGALHSCIGSLVEDQDGGIGRFWRACFAGLGDGDRVLDLGTGNGALPKLLLESTACSIRVDAVDLADPRPDWLASTPHPTVTFHPGVSMEALPFPAATFDLVVSQFGLEYAQWPDALDEAARVCRSDAGLALVLHHADSLVVRMGRVEQAHQQLLLADDGLVAVAIDLLPHLVRISEGAKPDASADRARQAYNDAMALIAERISGSDVPDLLIQARQQVHSILGGRFGNDPAGRRALLDDYAQALADASVRTQELLACALDEARAGELAEALRARLPGRVINRQPLKHGTDVVAWGINAG